MHHELYATAQNAVDQGVVRRSMKSEIAEVGKEKYDTFVSHSGPAFQLHRR